MLTLPSNDSKIMLSNKGGNFMWVVSVNVREGGFLECGFKSRKICNEFVGDIIQAYPDDELDIFIHVEVDDEKESCDRFFEIS